MDEEDDMEHPEELPDDWAWGPGGNIDALDEEAALFRDGPGGPRIEVRVRGREGWPTAMPAHMVGDLIFGGFQRYFAEQASGRGPRSRSLFSAGGDGAGGAASHPLLLRPQRLPVAGGSNSRVENEQSARPWASNFPAIPRSARGRFLVASEENENGRAGYFNQAMRDGRFAPMGNLESTITPWSVRRSRPRPAAVFSGGSRQQQQDPWSHPTPRGNVGYGPPIPGGGVREMPGREDALQDPQAGPGRRGGDPLLDDLHRSLILELPVIQDQGSVQVI